MIKYFKMLSFLSGTNPKATADLYLGIIRLCQSKLNALVD